MVKYQIYCNGPDRPHVIELCNGRLRLCDHGPCDIETSVPLLALGGPHPGHCPIIKYWWRHVEDYPVSTLLRVKLFDVRIPIDMVMRRLCLKHMDPKWMLRRIRKILHQTIARSEMLKSFNRRRTVIDFRTQTANVSVESRKLYIEIDPVEWFTHIYKNGLALVEDHLILSIAARRQFNGRYWVNALRRDKDEQFSVSPATVHRNGSGKWSLNWEDDSSWMKMEFNYLRPWD